MHIVVDHNIKTVLVSYTHPDLLIVVRLCSNVLLSV